MKNIIKIFIFISLLLFSFSAKAASIKNIIINGNERISDETILMFADININEQIDNTKINQIIKDLYNSNFFENVSIKFLENILTINIKELPLIESISFTGIKAEKIKKPVLKNLKLKSRSSFNEFMVLEDTQSISNTLRKLGFYFSEVEVYVETLENNKVKINYDIELGKKAKIKKISFIGNKIFKDGKLRSLIISEEYKFWKFISGKKFLNEDLIAMDQRLLKNFYLNKGFYNVKINSSFSKILKDNQFELIYNIDSGQKIYFNDFQLNLPIDFDPDNYQSINKLFNELKGEYYSLYNVEQILNKIDNITIEEQYESVDVKIDEEIVSDKINISFNISESAKIYVKKINIFGNNVTDETVIRNQVVIDEGDPFNSILYTKSINNIRSLNFFREVKGEVIDNKNEDTKTINISIEEKPTGEIFAGAGTGTAGTTVSFGVRENNYLGKGILLDTNANISAESIRGKFSVQNSNYKNSDKSVNLSLEASELDRLAGQGYKSQKTGFSTGTQFEYYNDLFLGISIENFAEKVTVNNSASTKQKKNAGNYFDSFLGFNFNYDKRNQKFATTSGFFSNYSIDLPLYSETGTLKNTYNFKFFSELYENNVSTTSVLIQSAASITGDDVKLSERLFIPESRLRGFERGKLGPKDGSDFIGGNYLTAINFTSTIPKLLENAQNIDFVAFLDAANIWGVDYDSTIDEKNDIRSSIGIGLNWTTPIGPLSFSYAEPLTKNSSDIIEKFRFNLGTTF